MFFACYSKFFHYISLFILHIFYNAHYNFIRKKAFHKKVFSYSIHDILVITIYIVFWSLFNLSYWTNFLTLFFCNFVKIICLNFIVDWCFVSKQSSYIRFYEIIILEIFIKKCLNFFYQKLKHIIVLKWKYVHSVFHLWSWANRWIKLEDE